MIHYGMAKDVPLLALAVNPTDLHGFGLLFLKKSFFIALLICWHFVSECPLRV